MKKIINFLPLLSIALALVIWSISAYSIDSEYVLPTIPKTIEKFLSLFSSGKFYLSVLFTFVRSVIAFLLSFIIAFVVSYFSYKSIAVKKFFAPLLAICRALPTVAVVLLLLFWTTSNIAPIIVTMIVILPTLFTETSNSFAGIDKTLIEMARLDRASEIEILFKIMLPQILPELLIIIGSGLSLNIKLMVASEVLSQTANSLGLMITVAKSYFEIATMIALVLISVLLSVAVEYLFKYLSKRNSGWRK